MNEKTLAALKSIQDLVDRGYDRITPSLTTRVYGRAASSAAYRIARELDLIEVSYMSAARTPVYRPFGVGAAILEARVAVKH